MESVYQGMALGSTREAGGGKVTGAVSNSPLLHFIHFPSSLLSFLLCLLHFFQTIRVKHLSFLVLCFTILFHSLDS